MHARRALGAALIALTTTPAQAVDLDAAKTACEADVRRLCTAGEIARAVFGSYGGVIECLKREQKRLSKSCSSEIRRIQNQGRK